MEFNKVINEALVDTSAMKVVREAFTELKKGIKSPSFKEILKFVKDENPSLKTMLDKKPKKSEEFAQEQQRARLNKLKDAYTLLKQSKTK